MVNLLQGLNMQPGAPQPVGAGQPTPQQQQGPPPPPAPPPGNADPEPPQLQPAAQQAPHQPPPAAQQAHLQALPPPPEPPAPALVESDEVIDKARAFAIAVGAAADNTKVKKLPDIVPGFHADVLSIAIPARVVAAVQRAQYVPYTQLSSTARLAEAAKRNTNTTLLSALMPEEPLERIGEQDIAVAEWLAAGDAMVKLVRTWHGDARANALEAHHRTVTNFAVTTDWQAAFAYDIAEREMAAANPLHDLGTPNQRRLNFATSEYLAKCNQKRLREELRIREPPLQDRRPPPGDSQLRKRPKLQGQSFQGRTANCFRCGNAGHLPSSCTATVTITGRPVAPLAPDARSDNALATPNGRAFCFSFALHSSCRDEGRCSYHHGCSICGATAHGAARCNRV
ncbi:hypothetical protein C8Q78DRAFT_544539 [Trametes maxima]|nr:hypothetical protein C8Q78DRAFT_544539 [Trametes maxima]